MQAKLVELEEVLLREEFDAARAERGLRVAEASGGTALDNAKLVHESILRLCSLRARAAGELDELLALCTRLRTQITVLRFAGQSTEDVGDLVSEIMGHIEGVGAVL